ncbi:MAG: peptide chain release factor N(5)-glutamine methyltransferase [Thiotrichales bacterium]|nr:peptide chain release factor N(5)-glutamine methyltransferase [Thiotrichales bacterium]
MATLANALANATQRLEHISDSARLDAELLAGHSLGLSRTQLFTRDRDTISAESLAAYEPLIQRREQGEPVAYIIGKREFWSLELTVNEHTLIPRPETELLVELVLKFTDKKQFFHIADLGTGSGAIALAIAKERHNSAIDACDTSTQALATARLNAQQHNINNIEFIQSDWFQNLAQKKYDLIVSNPPYIAPDDQHLRQGDLRFEPVTALSAANEGYADLLYIAEQATLHLTKNGYLIFEHGYQQQTRLIEKLIQLGYNHVKGHTDHSKQARAVSAQWTQHGEQ